MKLIVCLDDNRGMQFNKRRQSRDRLLIADLTEQLKDARLWIAPYSEPLFQKSDLQPFVTEAPMACAEKEDYCFLEASDPAPWESQIDEVILYHWNRIYPADLYFTMDMSHFRLVSSVEFVGSSHEKITKEVWKK